MALLRIVPFVILLQNIVVNAKTDSDVRVTPMNDKVGVLIVAEQPIAFTSLTWRLIFEWDLDPLKETLDTLQYIHQNLSRRTEEPLEQQALLQIGEALNTAEKDFNNFMNLVQEDSKILRRRSLKNPKDEAIDAFRGSTGSIASSIFGIATSEEMDNVHQYLDVLFRREAKMINVQKLHITTVKKLQSQLDIQQQQLDIAVNFSTNLYKYLKENLKNRTDANYAAILTHSDLISSITMFKMLVANYRQTLTSMDRGYMDPDLMPIRELQDTLTFLRDKIPQGFKLIYDPLRDDLSPYYGLKLAKRIPGSPNIRGMLQVPLTGFTDDYTLYKTVPFPSLMGNSTTRKIHDQGHNPIYCSVI